MPTLEASYSVVEGENPNDLVTPSIAVTANNEVLVAKISASDRSVEIVDVVDSAGGTWIRQVEIANELNYPKLEIWTAHVDAADTLTVTATVSGPDYPHSMIVERWSSASIPDTPTYVVDNAEGTPAITIETTLDESVVTWAVTDANAVDGAGRTYDETTVTPTENTDGYVFDSGWYTVYNAWQEAATAGVQFFGLTAPGAQQFTIAGFEVWHKEGTILREGTGVKQKLGTTTSSPVYPAGIVAGRLAVAGRGQKPETSTATAESGWVQQITATGGTGTTGVDVGQTRSTVDTRVLVGGEATPTFDQASTPNSIASAIMIYSCTSGFTWDIASASGNDSTHGTGRNATAGTSFAMAPGDVVLAISSSDTDAATAYTSPAITASGITFGTTTNLFTSTTERAGAATGNDCNLLWFQATVTAGTATAAAVLAASTGPSSCGPVTFIRLRELPSSVNATATPAVIARSVLLPAATPVVPVNATATPAAVARLAALPAATAKAGGDTAPAVIARSVTLPAGTRAAGSASTPGVIARAVTLPAPSEVAGSTTIPATITRTVVVPAPTKQAGSTTAPATVAAVVTVPAATASGEIGDSSATATPTVIAVTVELPAPATEAGSATVSPNDIPVAVVIPAAAPRAGGVTTPNRIICAVTIPAATASSVTNANVTPAAIAAAAAVLAPTLHTGSAVVPAVIALTIVIHSAATLSNIPDEHTRRYTMPHREITVAIWREPANTGHRETP